MFRRISFKLPFFILATLLLSACVEKAGRPFTFHYPGYYVRLLSFDNPQSAYSPGSVAWLSVQFCTQRDSVFWDSYNNLGDRYFLTVDSGYTQDHIAHFVSKCGVGDSACLLEDPAIFFRQQFRSETIPFFSERDTIVKVFLKLKRVLSPGEFRDLSGRLLNKEEEQIIRFYGNSAEAKAALTAQGYYLVDPPSPLFAEEVSAGDVVAVSYAGYFLDGRLLERSRGDFVYTFGTPGQVLDGLNIVIGRLNVGQTVKIILPSPLAFGEKGSSDKTVPPFTPLLYQLELKSINKQITP